MAAIVDSENKLDLDALAEGMRKSLPVYARPLFLRAMKSLPMTGRLSPAAILASTVIPHIFL